MFFCCCCCLLWVFLFVGYNHWVQTLNVIWFVGYVVISMRRIPVTSHWLVSGLYTRQDTLWHGSMDAGYITSLKHSFDSIMDSKSRQNKTKQYRINWRPLRLQECHRMCCAAQLRDYTNGVLYLHSIGIYFRNRWIAGIALITSVLSCVESSSISVRRAVFSHSEEQLVR